MNRKLFTSIYVILGITFICTSIFLPSALSEIGDGQFIGRTQTEQMEDEGVTYRHQMSTIDKIKLLSTQGESGVIGLSQGAVHNKDTAQQICRAELKKIQQMGLLPASLESDNLVLGFAQIEFHISINQPSHSMIVWVLQLYQQENWITCYLDDETGKLLKYTCNTSELLAIDDMEELARRWGEYLGVTIKRILINRLPYQSKTAVAEIDKAEKVDIVDENILVRYEADGLFVDYQITRYNKRYIFGDWFSNFLK